MHHRDCSHGVLHRNGSVATPCQPKQAIGMPIRDVPFGHGVRVGAFCCVLLPCVACCSGILWLRVGVWVPIWQIGADAGQGLGMGAR